MTGGRANVVPRPSDNDAGLAVEAATLAASDYEKRLESDSRWALSEGSRHFDEKSSVFIALHKIAARLDDLKMPYAVGGGMALSNTGIDASLRTWTSW